MPSKHLYKILILLFPTIYLIHNLEEWIVFRSKAIVIYKFIPNDLSCFIPEDPRILISIFGLALILATIVPIILSFYLWDKFSAFSAKVLIIIAFVTFINAISHIISTVVLESCSPGFITGILLFVPYAIGLTSFIIMHFTFTNKEYLFFVFISITVYFLGIILSWLVAMMILYI